MVTVLNFCGLGALAAHMIAHLYVATTTALEEEDGKIFLCVFKSVLRGVLCYDGLLGF